MNNVTSQFFVLGMPLDEEADISEQARATLNLATLIIGESRKVAFRYLKQTDGGKTKTIFLLDPPREDNLRELHNALVACRDRGEHAALFSDAGMPILYDPGREVLEWAKLLGFRVRSVAGPTSWGMAAALSGFLPPFYLVGFLPRSTEERSLALRDLAKQDGHLVLMDTPYRFRVLLEGCREKLGPKREAFLAWEIAKQEERLLWGSLSHLEKLADSLQLQKGEFVLIVKANNSK